MTLVAKVQHIRPQISYVLYYKSHSLKDAEIAELQQKLDKAMGMIQSLQSGQPAPARRAGSTPTTPVVTPQNKMIPKKASPPCQTSAPSSGEAPETPDDNSEARIFFMWKQRGVHIWFFFPSVSQLPAFWPCRRSVNRRSLKHACAGSVKKNPPAKSRFPKMSIKLGKLVVSNVKISWRSLSTRGVTR